MVLPFAPVMDQHEATNVLNAVTSQFKAENCSSNGRYLWYLQHWK